MSLALIVDVLTACLLAFFLVRGALRGFLGEVLSLVGSVVSAVAAWTLSGPAAEFVLRHFPSWDLRLTGLGCAVAIFFAISILFAALAELFSMLIAAANLSLPDHVLGLAMGAVKTFCVLLFVYGLLTMFSAVVPTGWMAESRAMRIAAAAWPPAVRFLEGQGLLDLENLRSGALSAGVSALALPSASQGEGAVRSEDVLAVPASPDVSH